MIINNTTTRHKSGKRKVERKCVRIKETTTGTVKAFPLEIDMAMTTLLSKIMRLLLFPCISKKE